MKPWLKDNKIVSSNGLICQDVKCPCSEGIYVPSFFPFFPTSCTLTPGAEPLTSTNTEWSLCYYDEFDIETQTWEKPPLHECIEDDDTRTDFFFGFTEHYAQFVCYNGGMYFHTGAKASRWDGLRPSPAYFIALNYNSQTDDADNIYSFEITNRPSDSIDIKSGMLAVISDYVYEYLVYVTPPEEETTLVGNYKVKISFDHFTHTDPEPVPAVADYIDYGDFPDGQNKYIPAAITAYNESDEIIFTDTQWVNIIGILFQDCIPDIDYCVVGSCSYYASDCSGCLRSSRVFVTQEQTAAKLSGDCRHKSQLTAGMTSKTYTVLACGFDTQAEANQYIDDHDLKAQLEESCGKGGWYIIGTCNCDDSDCEYCESGSLSIVCDSDFETGCLDSESTNIMAGPFNTQSEAQNVLDDNRSSYEDDLDGVCGDCGECGEGEWSIYLFTRVSSTAVPPAVCEEGPESICDRCEPTTINYVALKPSLVWTGCRITWRYGDGSYYADSLEGPLEGPCEQGYAICRADKLNDAHGY